MTNRWLTKILRDLIGEANIFNDTEISAEIDGTIYWESATKELQRLLQEQWKSGFTAGESDARSREFASRHDHDTGQ